MNDIENTPLSEFDIENSPELKRKRFKRMVRQGLLPRRMFVRNDPNSLTSGLQRVKSAHKFPRMKLTWKTVDTVMFLMGDL